jgi:hypothetical protein
VNILDEGLTGGIKDFQRGVGTPAIKEFNVELSFFNCLEPIHPVMSTAELDIVIKTFELRVGVQFVRDLLRIMNSLQADLNDSDELFFEKSLLSSKT